MSAALNPATTIEDKLNALDDNAHVKSMQGSAAVTKQPACDKQILTQLAHPPQPPDRKQIMIPGEPQGPC